MGYPSAMENGEIFRKVFHLCAPAFLVYYLVPADAWGLLPSVEGVLEPREVLLLAVLAVVLAEEAVVTVPSASLVALCHALPVGLGVS